MLNSKCMRVIIQMHAYICVQVSFNFAFERPHVCRMILHNAYTWWALISCHAFPSLPFAHHRYSCFGSVKGIAIWLSLRVANPTPRRVPPFVECFTFACSTAQPCASGWMLEHRWRHLSIFCLRLWFDYVRASLFNSVLHKDHWFDFVSSPLMHEKLLKTTTAKNSVLFARNMSEKSFACCCCFFFKLARSISLSG